ncbi:MAG: DVUA0089 family protein [Sandaracinaceae bacterium]
MILLVTGCAAPTEKPGELGALVDGKADGVAAIREHDTRLQDIREVGVELTDEVRGHAYRFTLGTEEQVDLFTARYSGEREGDLDTVLYLFRRGANGWGHYIRRNDDDPMRPETFWSRITEDLEPGEYRILVKAFADENGWIGLNMNCADGGCEERARVDPPATDDPGTGTPDRTGTGAVSIRVPVLDEDEARPLSRFNEQLTAAGQPTFPDWIELDGSTAPLDALRDQAQIEAVFAITRGELGLYWSISILVDAGLCYSGHATALPRLLGGLADSVFDDMFLVWGWRAEGLSAYDEWHEPTMSSSIYDEWQSYDASHGDVYIVYSEDDEGRERTILVPRCD